MTDHKETVLALKPSAVCWFLRKGSYVIRSWGDTTTLGKGSTPNGAWQDAAYNLTVGAS